VKLLGNLRQTLADRLTTLRARKGWTQHDLAAACVDPKTGEARSASWVRGYEQQVRWPDPEDLDLLAKALEVPVSELISTADVSGKAYAALAKEMSEVIDRASAKPRPLSQPNQALNPAVLQEALYHFMGEKARLTMELETIQKRLSEVPFDLIDSFIEAKARISPESLNKLVALIPTLDNDEAKELLAFARDLQRARPSSASGSNESAPGRKVSKNSRKA
jgi:transcriptional regulator with XRE-family HTH domain